MGIGAKLELKLIGNCFGGELGAIYGELLRFSMAIWVKMRGRENPNNVIICSKKYNQWLYKANSRSKFSLMISNT